MNLHCPLDYIHLMQNFTLSTVILCMLHYLHILNLSILLQTFYRVYNIWICQPIVVRNQRLFKFDEEFLRAVQKCTNKRQLAAIFRKFKYNNATRETKK